MIALRPLSSRETLSQYSKGYSVRKVAAAIGVAAAGVVAAAVAVVVQVAVRPRRWVKECEWRKNWDGC